MSNYGANVLGFQLGRTTPAEAIKILKSRNGQFDANLAYKGYGEILSIISVTSLKDAPNINGRLPDRIVLRFVENRLYQIMLSWWPGGDSLADMAEYKGYKIHESLIDALSEKYQRDPHKKNLKRDPTWLFWLRPKRGALLTAYNDYGEGGEMLTYIDNELSKRAERQKTVIDQRDEQDKASKLQNSL